MATITKDRLAALAANRPTKDFPIPGADGETARLRKVSIAEYREAMKGGGDDHVASAVAFLRVSWVDEDDAPMFTGKDGLAMLESLPVELLIPLFSEGVKFSGLDPDAIEGAEKNS